jgi:hypothetical protein
MKESVSIGLIAVIVTSLASLLVIPAFALVEFQSNDFGFSIKYPENWVVEDEVEDLGADPGFDDGFFSIVYFYDDPDFFTDSIEVTFTKNDNIARNNQGQKYLDRVESRLAENCEITVMEIDEYECSNFVMVDSDFFEHKGLPAYKFTHTWTDRYSDGSVFDEKSILVDIVDGNDVWTIDGISIESDFPKFEPTLEKVIESFSLKSNEDNIQKISDKENTTEFVIDGTLLVIIIVILGVAITVIIGLIIFIEIKKRSQQSEGIPFATFWNGLLPYQKWFFIGGIFMFPGIVMMRLSYNPDLGLGDIGLFGLLFTGIGLLILLFIMIPVMIGDLRAGKTSFFGKLFS